MSYSLKCAYYDREFKSFDELIQDIQISGMDPNYEILRNGVGIGENAADYLVG